MADAEVPIEEPRPKGELETGAETRTSIADRYTKVRKGVAERALGIRRIFPRFASSQEVTELNEFDAELNTITQETSWQLGSMGEEANTPAQRQESVADRIRRRIMLPPKRKAYITCGASFVFQD